jgi:hypothetical protein
LDARDAHPVWEETLDPIVSLDAHTGNAAAFDFWRLTGRKSLQHDGERLVLDRESGDGCVRVHLGEALCDGGPSRYVVPAGRTIECYRRMLDPVIRWMAGRSDPVGRSISRPPLGAVVHMRALLAHDAIGAGASQREVAAALFGDDIVAERWHPDSELRAHVRYLLDRARHLVDLGYLTLFGGKTRMHGDVQQAAKSP